MSPLEQRVQELERRLQAIERAESVPFIQSLVRRLSDTLNVPTRLSDLSDVSSTAPSSGQVLKWNGSQWAPGTDNIA